jgi:hypothetical protein
MDTEVDSLTIAKKSMTKRFARQLRVPFLIKHPEILVCYWRS